jgi:catechol 2,3-dioxygenase-like lactoylglutathione lyase family enzyme
VSTTESLPPLRGIHDLKFAVSDLDESLRFYERALDAKHLPELDHVRDDGTRFAAVVEVPGLGTVLQLRLDPERAARQAMFDPLAIAVDDRPALGRWDAALTELAVLHSPILEAVSGWLIVIQDPDGNASGSTRWSPTVPRSGRPPTARGWQGKGRIDA